MKLVTIIGIGVAAFSLSSMIIIIYRTAVGRKRFLKNLHENQVVKFGENERIGRIISVYMKSVELVDLQTCEQHKIRINEIYPL